MLGRLTRSPSVRSKSISDRATDEICRLKIHPRATLSKELRKLTHTVNTKYVYMITAAIKESHAVCAGPVASAPRNRRRPDNYTSPRIYSYILINNSGFSRRGFYSKPELSVSIQFTCKKPIPINGRCSTYLIDAPANRRRHRLQLKISTPRQPRQAIVFFLLSWGRSPRSRRRPSGSAVYRYRLQSANTLYRDISRR